MADRAIHFELTIRVISREVWSVLTDATKIPLWWDGVHAVQLTKPEPGGIYRLDYEGGNPDECRILDYDLGKRLRFEWQSTGPAPTIVEYTLNEQAGATHVVFHNSGYGEGAEWDRLHDANFAGWLSMFLGVRRMLEVAHSGERA